MGNVNLYGSFEPGPWKTDAEILKAIDNEDWFPGRDELKIFAGSGPGHVEQVKNIPNLMTSIARLESVTRVNIFTHATKGYISLHGWVTKGNVIFSDIEDEQLELDEDTLREATGNWTIYSDPIRPKSKPITLSDVRKKYGKGVHMVIYACHSGLDEEYLGNVAKLFGIPVHGFSSEIGYHPVSKSNKRILHWEFFVKPSEKVKQVKMLRHFHHLTPDIIVKP